MSDVAYDIRHTRNGGWKVSFETFIILYNINQRNEYFLNYSVEIPTRCGFVIEFIIPKFFKGSTCF
jgi:hypothetical protein